MSTTLLPNPFGLSEFPGSSAKHHRKDLNKTSLPRPETTTALKPIPNRVKILHIKSLNGFKCTHFKAVFVSAKISF